MSRVILLRSFYHVGGTVSSDALSYVQRQADQELLEHAAAGDFCYVLTPRQTGKSSLMFHTVAQLKKKRIRSVVINLQRQIEHGMAPNPFFAGLISECIRELKLPVQLDQWWREHDLLSAVQRFANFVADEVLPRVQKRVVVFIDEIDSTLNLDFSDDVFAAIRAFYNERARNPAFKRLTFVLLGVAAWCLERVIDWTGGHPYLTQRVCAALAADEQLRRGERRVDEVINALFFSDAMWSDANLANVRDRIVEDKDNPAALLELYRRILLDERVLDDERSPVHTRLKLSGLVSVFPGGVLRPRNKIYERVFDLAWVDTLLRTTSDIRLSASYVIATQGRKTGSENLDISGWRAQVAERLRAWASSLNRQRIDSVYAFLAAITLWPIVENARAGDWTAPILLGRVLAGVAGGMLPNAIRNWKSEAQAAQQITALASSEPTLLAELDAVLQTVDTITLARQTLSEADHRWVVRALRSELAHHGNLSRFAAQLTGSGAIAQGGGAVAAGAGGVAVGGDVQDRVIITGDRNVFIGTTYTGPTTRDPDKALKIYREEVVKSCRHVSLRGLDIGASDASGIPQRFDLTQVYVDLDTTTRVPRNGRRARHGRQQAMLEERNTRPLRALEAVVQHPQLVLLGDPGSGKSTFLTHLALCLAAHRLEPQKGWLKRLPKWPTRESDVIPIVVVLRDFARWIPAGTKQAEPNLLWRFIQERLEAQNLSFATDPIHDVLEQGQVMLLLDGLDEIPTAEQRSLVRDAVAALAARYRRCRLVVTCRPLSYQDPAWQLTDVQSVELAPFNEAQIDRFVEAWYSELARLGSIKPGTVEGVARQLQTAIRRADLWRLASNPLLLTVMALVHAHRGRLPEARALLYDETIDILLWRWDQVRAIGEGETPRLRQLLAQAGRSNVELQLALGRLAFEVHRDGRAANAGAIADINEVQLYKALIGLHPDRSYEWAHQVIEVVKLRAGLLLERAPEVYTFPHRTFQEYLAGAHLSTLPDFALQAAQLVAEGALWREVILLAVGRLVYRDGQTAKPLELVAELCPAHPANTEAAWRQVWLAGDVLLEMGLNRVDESALGRELVARVRDRLVALLRGGHLSPVERAVAGDTLARLGDPRFRADAWHLPDEPLLGFVEIPAGPFWMGSDQHRDPDAIDTERPQHEVTLPRYFIGRYPVTVAQFRGFVEDTGSRAEDETSLHGLLNHPVVDVTWHRALEYCTWLTERLRERPRTPEPLATLLRKDGWQVLLPSEAEWEKAARGADGRIYPWGNAPDPNRANYDDSGITATSAVGCFPDGASPYGVEELSGNVWEWTRSLWGTDFLRPDFKYPYDPGDGRENREAPERIGRVLRGGAFNDSRRYVRCAYRYWSSPNVRNWFIGFRVVVQPCH